MKAMDIAAFGMTAQQERLKVIAQNIANSDSTGSRPGEAPYQRKTVSFKSVMDDKLGFEKVEIDKVGRDKTPFEMKYDPAHPAANAEGYYMLPNVNTLVEMTDMREAKNSYQANLSVIEIAKTMMSRTLDLLRV